MNTRTILSAYMNAERVVQDYWLTDTVPVKQYRRACAMRVTFLDELKRRMDAGDKGRATFPLHTPDHVVSALNIHTATLGILDQRKVMR